MLQLQRGDEEAFRRVVLHYGRTILGFFRRFGADAASAEDLTQEALLRVYRARQRYEPSARFSTWLHRILHRMAINDASRNRWRRAQPWPQEEADSEPIPAEEGGTAPDPVLEMQRTELREQVRQAVAALPPNQRTALLLNRFEGQSYEEVGAALGLSVPATKSLLFRARESIKNTLAPLMREERNELPAIPETDS
jgi:RNA polymerase sigma-70 factor (ECF subfamily)